MFGFENFFKNLYKITAVSLVVAWPLAIWKAIDIFCWIWSNVNVNITF